ncbi:MAG: hypothetical protein ABI680_15120, partial [Chthoniobacteraceae bacterium]
MITRARELLTSAFLAAGIAFGASDVPPDSNSKRVRDKPVPVVENAEAAPAPALHLADDPEVIVGPGGPAVPPGKGEMKTFIDIETKLIEVAATSRREFLRNLRAPNVPDRSALDRLDAALTNEPTVTILTPDQADAIVRFVNQQSGVEMVSSPRAATRAGQRMTVENTRAFRYPTTWITKSKPFTPENFKVRNCGFTFDVTPVLFGEAIIPMTAKATVVEFLGIVDTQSGATFPRTNTEQRSRWRTEVDFGYPAFRNRVVRHVFSTRETEVQADLPSGSSLLVTGMRETEDVSDFPDIAPKGQLILLVTGAVRKEAVGPAGPPARAVNKIEALSLENPPVESTPPLNLPLDTLPP